MYTVVVFCVCVFCDVSKAFKAFKSIVFCMDFCTEKIPQKKLVILEKFHFVFLTFKKSGDLNRSDFYKNATY